MAETPILLYTITTKSYDWAHYAFAEYLQQEAEVANFTVLIIFNNSSDEWVEEQTQKFIEVQKISRTLPPFVFINAGKLPPAEVVGLCRNKAFAYARQHGYDWLYSIDIDTIPSLGTIIILRRELIRCGAGIIGAKYYKRLENRLGKEVTMTICAMFTDSFSMEMTTVGRTNNRMKVGTVGLKGEVEGVGFGCTMMAKEFFAETDIPPIQEVDGRKCYVVDGQAYGTEDLPFCKLARAKTNMPILWTDIVRATHLHMREDGNVEVF